MAERTNEEWLSALSVGGEQREAALEDLRAILLRGLSYALSTWLPPDSPEFSPFTEEVVQDTLLRILDRLDTFEGRSRFTTWAHKIAIRMALTDLRRRRWRNVSLDELTDEEEEFTAPVLLTDSSAGPESHSERSSLLARVSKIVFDELTEKQKRAILVVAVKGVPMDEAAEKLGMQRNALYKLIHDARLKIRQRLEQDGFSPQEVLAVFAEK